MTGWKQVVVSVVWDGLKSWWQKRQKGKTEQKDKEEKDGHLP